VLGIQPRANTDNINLIDWLGEIVAFYSAVMVFQHLNDTRSQGVPKPLRKPVALVMIPLIELGHALYDPC
jgi:hypothetical protein